LCSAWFGSTTAKLEYINSRQFHADIQQTLQASIQRPICISVKINVVLFNGRQNHHGRASSSQQVYTPTFASQRPLLTKHRTVMASHKPAPTFQFLAENQIPVAKTLIVACADPRSDPSYIFGLNFGGSWHLLFLFRCLRSPQANRQQKQESFVM
jgi:hypothetical protein